MNTPATFERYEIKYLLSAQQQGRLYDTMQSQMKPDQFGNSTICNVYYDTPSSLLIRRSLEKPVYKEKLRMRSYGKADPGSTVFVELKKKFRGVVYKRRVQMACHFAEEWLAHGNHPVQRTPIINEIDYVCQFYGELVPKVYLSYEREAFFSKEDSTFRMTFDKNILFRTEQVSLCAPPSGQPLLPVGQRLLEVKSAYGLPLWLTHFLSAEGLFKTNFSKYGNAYRTLQSREMKGDMRSA